MAFFGQSSASNVLHRTPPAQARGDMRGAIPTNWQVYNSGNAAFAYDPATKQSFLIRPGMGADVNDWVARNAAANSPPPPTVPVSVPPPPPSPEVLAPFQQSPLAPTSGAVQNPIPLNTAPPVFNPLRSGAIGNVLPPVLSPPPLGGGTLSANDLGAPPPLPPAAQSINAPPPKSALPPLPPPAPAPAFNNPIAGLQNLQGLASPMGMSPLAPPSGLNNAASGAIPATPSVHPLGDGIPSPLAPMTGVPATPPGVAGQITPAPTQTLADTIGGPATQGGAATPISAPVGEDAGVGMQSPGIAPAGGGPSSAQAPALTPPGDEGRPQPIPFRPNNPIGPVPQFGAGNNIEDFLGDFGKMNFGPNGILGAPGKPRAPGQSESDFLRQLLSHGLFGSGGL